jgi:hypothetical protein
MRSLRIGLQRQANKTEGIHHAVQATPCRQRHGEGTALPFGQGVSRLCRIPAFISRHTPVQTQAPDADATIAWRWAGDRAMNWFDLHELTKWAPLPGGYRFLPTRADFEMFSAFIRLWLPDVGGGAASCPVYVLAEIGRLYRVLCAKWLARGIDC